MWRDRRARQRQAHAEARLEETSSEGEGDAGRRTLCSARGRSPGMKTSAFFSKPRDTHCAASLPLKEYNHSLQSPGIRPKTVGNQASFRKQRSSIVDGEAWRDATPAEFAHAGGELRRRSSCDVSHRRHIFFPPVSLVE